MQHEDPVLSPIIQKIDQNDVSLQVSNYFINGEGLLRHLSKHPSRSPRSNTTRKQVCIPHCLKARILESIHSEYGGHLKFFKTYHRLSENFFWLNMYKDTKNFVRSCTVCLSRKNAFKIPPAPHRPVEQNQEPGETCHIDIFGPLKTTPKELWAFIKDTYRVIPLTSTGVEKPNQSLANILASITQNTNDWDEQLPHTILALNSAIHEATYTSSFFLEHGRDIRLSYTYEKNSDTPQNKYEYVEKLLPSLEQIFNKVLRNLKEQEASHIDLSTRATKQHHYDYKIGSLCFIKTPNIKSNLSPKLRPKFEVSCASLSNCLQPLFRSYLPTRFFLLEIWRLLLVVVVDANEDGKGADVGEMCREAKSFHWLSGVSTQGSASSRERGSNRRRQ
ncbi:integrase catalytic domain-containing protein [Trichonephila clavipes]|nr:integrase catalytic domain-containing protein [Trichonephila clavipes]